MTDPTTIQALPPEHPTPQWRHTVTVTVPGLGAPLAASRSPQRAGVVAEALERWATSDPEGLAAAVQAAVDAERAQGVPPSNMDVRLSAETSQEVADALRPIIERVRRDARDGRPAPGYTAPEAWEGYYLTVTRQVLDAVLPSVQQQWLPGTTAPDRRDPAELG